MGTGEKKVTRDVPVPVLVGDGAGDGSVTCQLLSINSLFQLSTAHLAPSTTHLTDDITRRQQTPPLTIRVDNKCH